MNPKLKGICVGAGYFSHFQYKAWTEIPEVEILAVCNRSTNKAQAIAEQYNIPQVFPITQFEAMLDELKPDFVDIITPPETHLGLVRAAAARGITIICQKPLAPTWSETLEIQEVLKAHPVKFMVHENWRWQPWYRQLKTRMDADDIGDFFHCAVQTRLGDGWGEDAYLARQPFFRDYKRLFIFETGVHFLDTFRFLFGEVESIYAKTSQRNPVIKGEDSALIVCNFNNGGTAVLDANRYNESDAENPRYTFGSLRIDGSKGHLEMDLEGAIRNKPLGETAKSVQYSPSKEGFAGNCVYEVQRHFVDTMLASVADNNTGECECNFESTCEDYLESVKLVEAAYESAATNSVIHLKTYTPKP